MEAKHAPSPSPTTTFTTVHEFMQNHADSFVPNPQKGGQVIEFPFYYDKRIASQHPQVIFVFGDNATMEKARRKEIERTLKEEIAPATPHRFLNFPKFWNKKTASPEATESSVITEDAMDNFMVELRKTANSVTHKGKGQAVILNGKYKPNVIGVPTCKFTSKEEGIECIQRAFRTLRRFIDKGYTILLPYENGSPSLGKGRAANYKYPHDFPLLEVQELIAIEIASLKAYAEHIRTTRQAPSLTIPLPSPRSGSFSERIGPAESPERQKERRSSIEKIISPDTQEKKGQSPFLP